MILHSANAIQIYMILDSPEPLVKMRRDVQNHPLPEIARASNRLAAIPLNARAV